MHVVIMYYCDKTEFERTMEIVKPYGQEILESDIDNSLIQFIYIEYKSKHYKFDRFNAAFINVVNCANDTYPYNHCPGIKEHFLHIYSIDNRFTDSKYYTILRSGRLKESLSVDKDAIIRDLYNGTYVRPSGV